MDFNKDARTTTNIHKDTRATIHEQVLHQATRIGAYIIDNKNSNFGGTAAAPHPPAGPRLPLDLHQHPGRPHPLEQQRTSCPWPRLARSRITTPRSRTAARRTAPAARPSTKHRARRPAEPHLLPLPVSARFPARLPRQQPPHATHLPRPPTAARCSRRSTAPPPLEPTRCSPSTSSGGRAQLAQLAPSTQQLPPPRRASAQLAPWPRASSTPRSTTRQARASISCRYASIQVSTVCTLLAGHQLPSKLRCQPLTPARAHHYASNLCRIYSACSLQPST
nr:uncharacterized protein LOC127346727 [Lolium perenne]